MSDGTISSKMVFNVAPPEWLTFMPSGLRINLHTGEVVIPDDLTLSEASRIFWEALRGYHPSQRHAASNRSVTDLERAQAAVEQFCGYNPGERWQPLILLIAKAIAETVAAERERIAHRVSEREILRLSVGRDSLVEVNEIIQDLAHDVATDWEDYE